MEQSTPWLRERHITISSTYDSEITETCTIIVTRESSTEGQLPESRFSVRTQDGQILVESDNTRDEIFVISASGQLEYKGFSREIPVHASGLYIVRQGMDVEKVIVR